MSTWLRPYLGRALRQVTWQRLARSRHHDARAGCGYSRRDLLALHGLGPKAVSILDAALAGHGLAFAD